MRKPGGEGDADLSASTGPARSSGLAPHLILADPRDVARDRRGHHLLPVCIYLAPVRKGTVDRVECEWLKYVRHALNLGAESGIRFGYDHIKLTCPLGTTWRMSPESSTPRPPLQSAQCRTVPPSKCPPSLTSVSPGPIDFVSRSQNCTAESGRITHWRSAACKWIGTPPSARLHSTMVV